MKTPSSSTVIPDSGAVGPLSVIIVRLVVVVVGFSLLSTLGSPQAEDLTVG